MATKKSTKKTSSKKASKKQKKFLFFCVCVLVLVTLGMYLWGPREQVITIVYDVTGVTLPEALPWEYKDGDQGFDLGSFVASLLTTEAPSNTQQSVAISGEIPSGMEIPVCAHTSDSHEIHSYTGFTLCYRDKYEQSEWVAYEINKDELKKEASRTDDFRSDPAISTGSATPADYKASGYDRGHLAPAADMAWSKVAMSESFFMSNMSPQVPGLNRGAWKDLEATVRNWVEDRNSIYIITGPVLDKDSYPTIGNNVAVPDAYYKVLFAPEGTDGNAQMIGFLFANEKTTEDYPNYAVTVDEIEKLTGLDFFHALDDEIENKLESSFDINAWAEK